MAEPTRPGSPIVFRYQFSFSNGDHKSFTVTLDPDTLQLMRPEPSTPPAWTRLRHSQCPNCPLNETQSPHCPAATSLIDVVDYFGRSRSIEQVEVRVETAERDYVKRCALQEAASSLIGLYMATSGCQVMAKLKPMARFHLPFSTLDETHYRVLSMYLLAQYVAARRGQSPDWEFTTLVRLYEDVLTVNSHFFKRLASADLEDASLNAIVRLDSFAGSIAFTVDQQILDELDRLFDAYLERPGERGPAAS